MSEVFEPEVLPPGGPLPGRKVGPVPPPKLDWTLLLGTALALDLLGVLARGPFRLVAALIGAVAGAWLTPHLRIPLRFLGWMSAAAGLYASMARPKFMPIALLAVALRAWQVRRRPPS